MQNVNEEEFSIEYEPTKNSQSSIDMMSIFIDTLIRYENHINGGEDSEGEEWKKALKVDEKTDLQVKKIFKVQLKMIEKIAKKELKNINNE